MAEPKCAKNVLCSEEEEEEEENLANVSISPQAACHSFLSPRIYLKGEKKKEKRKKSSLKLKKCWQHNRREDTD